MPVFNVQIVQRVTKFNEERTESTVVDRVIVNKVAVIALDLQGAAAIAGRDIPADYDLDRLSQAMVKVQKVAD